MDAEASLAVLSIAVLEDGSEAFLGFLAGDVVLDPDSPYHI